MNYNNPILQEDLKLLSLDNLNFHEEIRDKKILISGANGMIASYLVYYFMFLNMNYNYNIFVIAMCRNKGKAYEKYSEFITNKNFKLIIHDVSNSLDIENDIDYIIHAASSADPYSIVNKPLSIIEANIFGTLNLLKYGKQHNVKKFILLSTREVYGEVKSEFISENTFGSLNPLDLRSSYPESKRMAENICTCFNKEYGLPFNTLRIAHCYGPGMAIKNDGRVMADLLNSVVHNENIRLNSDGSTKRAFCYITDVIQGILIILNKGIDGEAYNLANETETVSILQLAEKLIMHSGHNNLKVEYINVNEKTKQGYTNYPRVQLSTEKIFKLGWYPKVSLDQGIKRTIESFNEK